MREIFHTEETKESKDQNFPMLGKKRSKHWKDLSSGLSPPVFIQHLADFVQKGLGLIRLTEQV